MSRKNIHFASLHSMLNSEHCLSLMTTEIKSAADTVIVMT